jgi:alanyl aminopeptidase
MSDGSRHTLRSTSSFVLDLRSHLVSPAMRVNYERFVRATYADRARRLGWEPLPGEGEETRLLRPELMALVGGAGEDREIQKQARVLADRWLKDKKAVSPDMVGTVMALAGRHGDQAYFDRLLELARKEKDRTRRSVLLGALASFRDPAIVQKRLTLLLSNDFDIRELRGFFSGTRTSSTCGSTS